jgi:nucleoside-diphosphate-sugar epimerase
MKRLVAVTGATGLIGRHVVSLLEDRGFDVKVLSRRESNLGSSKVVLGDLAEPAALGRLLQGVDTVIHLAGVAHTTLRTPEEREKAWRVNVGGTQLLLEQCRKMGVRRALLTSSVHVYRQHRGSEIDECSPIGNENFYSRTKEAVEKLAESEGSGLDIIIIRPCLTYGAGVRFNLEQLMKALDRGYYFHLSGSDPKRSFLSVHNAAAAFVHLLDHGSDRQRYNVADEHPESLIEFVNRLAARIGTRAPRRLPYGLAQVAVLGLTPLTKLGMKPPINRERVTKLTETFTVSVRKLAETGFMWPDRGELAQQQMAEFYIASKRRNRES